MRDLTSVEICAGAGGAALGLNRAGFAHVALAEINPDACATLRLNHPGWKVIEGDVRALDGRQFHGVDLLSGGPNCQPFTSAGHQLGEADPRDVVPELLRLAAEIRPRAVLMENVRGLLEAKFGYYQAAVTRALEELGYRWRWQVLQAGRYGVPQLRPRAVLVAMPADCMARFSWPRPAGPAPSVGEVLGASMASRGWEGARGWAAHADAIAPTIAAGSMKHGGPDLGPTRAKRYWRDRLGTNAYGLADEVPAAGEFDRPPTRAELHQGTAGLPKLTVAQVALLQGFPPVWEFAGRKTSQFRQCGNAWPPPAAQAVGEAIAAALDDCS